MLNFGGVLDPPRIAKLTGFFGAIQQLQRRCRHPSAFLGCWYKAIGIGVEVVEFLKSE